MVLVSTPVAKCIFTEIVGTFFGVSVDKNLHCFFLNPITLAGFEPGIFCSGGGRDDHYATPPGQTLQRQITLYICSPVRRSHLEDSCH
jgi:hypothetical protein